MRREAASIHIQKHVRAHKSRRNYKNLQAAAIVIQTGLRALAARNEYRYRRRTKAANNIQVTLSKWNKSGLQCFKANNSWIYSLMTDISFFFLQTEWRRFQAISAFKQQKKATVTLQCLWRARVARKELRNLRMVSIRLYNSLSLNYTNNSSFETIKAKVMMWINFYTGCERNWGT